MLAIKSVELGQTLETFKFYPFGKCVSKTFRKIHNTLGFLGKITIHYL